MKTIFISSELRDRCPNLRLACIEAEVSVADSSGKLRKEILQKMEEIQQQLVLEGISKIPEIDSSRKGYRACGKDPARYRLSAEALLRRVVSGKELYHISNVVDQLNLVSISSGFSIGGYDSDQIKGNVIFGIGHPGEPYSGIGRGELNIENLPVFRDDLGAFGTPTSDSQRTEVNRNTTGFLMILIDFGNSEKLNHAKEFAIRLLKEYCSATILANSVIR
ncbi:MAG: phenylalanine--tRNA ligase beta subunit-related protein [Prolixibacteraceae bacterium]